MNEKCNNEVSTGAGAGGSAEPKACGCGVAAVNRERAFVLPRRWSKAFADDTRLLLVVPAALLMTIGLLAVGLTGVGPQDGPTVWTRCGHVVLAATAGVLTALFWRSFRSVLPGWVALVPLPIAVFWSPEAVAAFLPISAGFAVLWLTQRGVRVTRREVCLLFVALGLVLGAKIAENGNRVERVRSMFREEMPFLRPSSEPMNSERGLEAESVARAIRGSRWVMSVDTNERIPLRHPLTASLPAHLAQGFGRISVMVVAVLLALLGAGVWRTVSRDMKSEPAKIFAALAGGGMILAGIAGLLGGCGLLPPICTMPFVCVANVPALLADTVTVGCLCGMLTVKRIAMKRVRTGGAAPVSDEKRESLIQILASIQDAGVALDELHGEVVGWLEGAADGYASVREMQTCVADKLETILRNALSGVAVRDRGAKRFMLRDILWAVANEFEVSVDDMISAPLRKSHARDARDLALVVLRENFLLSSESLAHVFRIGRIDALKAFYREKCQLSDDLELRERYGRVVAAIGLGVDGRVVNEGGGHEKV